MRLLLFMMCACLLAACEKAKQDMYDQPKYKPMAESSLFEDGTSARPLPQGSVAHATGPFAGASSGRVGEDDVRQDGIALSAQTIPYPVTPQLLKRGQERYSIYCLPCHSPAGDGDGWIARRGFPRPPSYHTDSLRNAPDRHFFDVISNGYGIMHSYADRVEPPDRWAIVAYIRVLQLSQHADVKNLPAQMRAQLPGAKGGDAMKNKAAFIAIAIVALLLCALGWRMHRTAFLAAYLAVWWFWFGASMGGLANVWLHNLTGGAWGEAIREPLLRFARTTWIAALLFLPLLLGMHDLYPWAAGAGTGTARWTGELSAPAFKNVWLMPAFFAARSIAYLTVLSALALLSQRPPLRRSKPFSAAAMIVYGFVISLASVDWVMSLMPLWYSSVFGWLVAMGQMLAGMALAIVLAVARSPQPAPVIFRDLGNLLLMYVMSWAYLAFAQFLIIWAENLPHEIAWYLPRMRVPWLVVAWLLVLFFFAAPLLILLSRNAKQSPRLMGWLAGALLLMQFVDCCWLILPSLTVNAVHWLWALPLNLALLGSVAFTCWRRFATPPSSVPENAHA